MSGLEVVGLVIALVELGRRIALAVKDVSPSIDRTRGMSPAFGSFDYIRPRTFPRQ